MRGLSVLGLVGVILFPTITTAAPTAIGLTMPNPNSGSNLLGDTLATNALWVTPPRQGTLTIGSESLAIDAATCEAVASINARRLSYLKTYEAVAAQMSAIEQYKTAILKQASDEGWGPEKTITELAKFDPLVASTQVRLDQVAESTKFDPVPPHLYQSAGYYSTVANADWEGMIDEVRAANPDYTVNGIPTANVKVYVSVLDAEGFKSNELIAKVNVGNFSDLTSVVEGIQVDIEPTKIGACFIKFPQIMRGEATPYAFGMALTYTYNIAITSKVHATYNLNDVYQYISRSGKSGGFFSSRSWKEVTESRDVDEMFNIDISFEHDATPQEIEAERIRVREYLLGYAVDDMVKHAGQEGPLGKTGAAVASEVLVKSCGLNVYCQGAAAGLAILDGIFGKSSSSIQIKQTLNVNRTYDSTVTEAIAIPAAISFTVTP